MCTSACIHILCWIWTIIYIYCACVILPLSHMAFYIIKQTYIASYHSVFCKLWTRTVRVSQQTLAGATKIWDQRYIGEHGSGIHVNRTSRISTKCPICDPFKNHHNKHKESKVQWHPFDNELVFKQAVATYILHWFRISHFSPSLNMFPLNMNLQTFRIYLKHPKAIHWTSPPPKKTKG